jgi:putative ABC transport system permease protein
LLGALGGLVGCALASLLSWGLLAFVFDLPWSLQPTILAVGLTATIVLTVFVGFLSTYRILGQAPLAVLRHD